MALISWALTFNPQLPLLTRPPVYPEDPKKSDYIFGDKHPVLGAKGNLDDAASTSRDLLAKHTAETETRTGNEMHPVSVKAKIAGLWDPSNTDEATRVNSRVQDPSSISSHLSESSHFHNTKV